MFIPTLRISVFQSVSAEEVSAKIGEIKAQDRHKTSHHTTLVFFDVTDDICIRKI